MQSRFRLRSVSAPLSVMVSAIVGVTVLVVTSLATASSSQAQASPLIISELLASNETGLLDEDGDRSDWIEIFNPSDQAVSVDGWFLTDELSQPTKWSFPAGQIPAGGFLVVFASSKDRAAGAELHTNFRLSQSGETVVLLTPDLVVAAQLDFGTQFDDVSVGPDPGGGLSYFDPPTPGEPNGPALVGFALEQPQLTPERGLFSEPVEVLMSTGEPGGTVRYTTDGSAPTATSTIATGPLMVDETTTIMAATFTQDGMSKIVTSSYFMIDEVIADREMNVAVTQGAQYGARMHGSLRSVPSVFLTMQDLSGAPVDPVYLPVSVEWVDVGETHQIDAGIKIYGGKSIRDKKKNYRLKFSDEFGPSRLDFDFYSNFAVGSAQGITPTTRFDKLELRSGSGDTNHRSNGRDRSLQLRSAIADDAMLEMGIPNPHNRYVHVYLNQDYRGTYDLRERFDSDFMASYFGGDDSDYDATNSGQVFQGTATAWQAIRSNQRWDYLHERLDMDGFIDFMLFNYWNGTLDWYDDKNWASAGPSDDASAVGWTFVNKDPDNGMARRNEVNANLLSEPGPNGIFRSLVRERHPEFMDALAAAVERNMTGVGALTPARAQARLDYRSAQLGEPLVAEAARWGTCSELCQSRGPLWDPDDEWTTHREYLRTEWIPHRTDVVIEQMRRAGWLPVATPELDRCCTVVPGETVTISTTDGVGSIIYTTTGSDPRLDGGAVSPSALIVNDATEATVTIDEATRLVARVKRGDKWSAARTWDLTIEGAGAPVILNEWNAVERTQTLANGDITLGQVAGNGGDWFELAVIDDHVDMRNWSLEIATGGAPSDVLSLSSDPILSDLRSGTIITVSESLPEDWSYDPARGDWHINLRAGSDGTGRFISAQNFAVNAEDWQLSIRDSSGISRSGPTGEGIGATPGISDTEIGELETHPSGQVDPAADYGDGNGSTFGLPNGFAGIFQDFSGLRSVVATAGDVDCDGRLSIVDALMIAQYSAGNRTSAACPLGDSTSQLAAANGDINDDSGTGIVDALVVARCVVGAQSQYCSS